MEYESSALIKIHEKQIIEKNECFFIGFIEGILANERVDESEVEPLLAECDAICRLVRDEDAAEIIAEANAGHTNTVAELLDLLSQIAEVRASRMDASCSRSAANRILGFCAGVNCDAVITTKEAKGLLLKLRADHDLATDPRIQMLQSALIEALQDDFIEGNESEAISSLITALVGDSYADTGIPSSETLPVVQDLDEINPQILDGAMIVLTGEFSFGTRQQVAAFLEEFGAVLQQSPGKKTNIVIIGANGSLFYTHKHHGGKLAKALKLRGEGSAPRIYVEAQLRSIFNQH